MYMRSTWDWVRILAGAFFMVGFCAQLYIGHMGSAEVSIAESVRELIRSIVVFGLGICCMASGIRSRRKKAHP